MASSSYVAAVRASIEKLCAGVTLKELTNQRAGETATDGSASTHPSINDNMIDEVIDLAASEIEGILGDGATTDKLHKKYTAELSIVDMADKWSIDFSDLGMQDRNQILSRAKDEAKRRVKSKKRVHKNRRKSGWKKGAAQFDPFDEVS